MTAEEFEKEWCNGFELDINQRHALMIEFAKIKCEELLEIVAEKAKIIDEDNDVYEQPHVFISHGEEYKTWVDKDSILNAVDLDEFIR